MLLEPRQGQHNQDGPSGNLMSPLPWLTCYFARVLPRLSPWATLCRPFRGLNLRRSAPILTPMGGRVSLGLTVRARTWSSASFIHSFIHSFRISIPPIIDTGKCVTLGEITIGSARRPACALIIDQPICFHEHFRKLGSGADNLSYRVDSKGLFLMDLHFSIFFQVCPAGT
jgi:hypothetical protein